MVVKKSSSRLTDSVMGIKYCMIDRMYTKVVRLSANLLLYTPRHFQKSIEPHWISKSDAVLLPYYHLPSHPRFPFVADNQ